MNGRALATAASFAAGTVFFAGVSLTISKRSHAEARLAGPDSAIVNTLDRMCQEKFQTIDYRDFGMSRIALPRPSHPGLRRFVPANDAEKGVVADARNEGWDAVLYVAGRSALGGAGAPQSGAIDGAPAPPSFPPARAGRRDLSDGALLTGTPRAALPARGRLLEGAVRAFRAFGTEPVYGFSAGEWSVLARPVRAEKAQCVSCHQRYDGDRSLKVGDVLGVAMYAFAPARP